VLLDVRTKGCFDLLLGNFGRAYFNSKQFMKLPRMGEFSALEYASLLPR